MPISLTHLLNRWPCPENESHAESKTNIRRVNFFKTPRKNTPHTPAVWAQVSAIHPPARIPQFCPCTGVYGLTSTLGGGCVRVETGISLSMSPPTSTSICKAATSMCVHLCLMAIGGITEVRLRSNAHLLSLHQRLIKLSYHTSVFCSTHSGNKRRAWPRQNQFLKWKYKHYAGYFEKGQDLHEQREKKYRERLSPDGNQMKWECYYWSKERVGDAKWSPEMCLHQWRWRGRLRWMASSDR